jgi:SMODS and SLOG-associating 2TM effector domain 2
MSGENQGAKSGDIQASGPGSLQWKSDQVRGSLDGLLRYVETEAAKSLAWYWDSKKSKARWSQLIRMSALVLTAAGALVPVVFYIGKELGWTAAPVATSGLWASALVGIAAAMLGLDRAFGFSSGWARYVVAATDIRKRLEEFRMDWVALTAASKPEPSADEISALIQKAKEFRIGVEGIVAQETKDWVTEFQSNMAQLEKDVKAQLDNLKVQVDKSQQAQQAATEPGSIEATIENADKTKDFAFLASLDGPDGVVVKDEKTGSSKTWARANVKPGQYRLVIAATTPENKPAYATSIVVVKPREVAKTSIRLPIGA